jgi:cyclomaltodextrin glucanotransferase
VSRSDEPRTLDVANLELADGTYADLLGGPSLVVQGGAARVTLPPRAIAVFEQPGALPAGQAVVEIQAHGFETRFGERLLVCGDAPELGSWDLAKAVPMEWIDRTTWSTTVAMDASAGRPVHYKFVVQRGARFEREPGRGHHRVVPAAGPATWRDEWRA